MRGGELEQRGVIVGCHAPVLSDSLGRGAIERLKKRNETGLSQIPSQCLRAVSAFEPAQEPPAGKAARQRQVIFLEDVAAVPAAGRPGFQCASKARKIDHPPHQRRLVELLELARKLAALASKLFVPIRRLQSAQTI